MEGRLLRIQRKSFGPARRWHVTNGLETLSVPLSEGQIPTNPPSLLESYGDMATRDRRESLVEFVENVMADYDFRGSHTWTGWRLHAVGDIDRYTEEGGGTRWTARARVIIVRYRRGQATHQQGSEPEQTSAGKAGGAGADAGNGADASTITRANTITNTGTRRGDLTGASRGAHRGADTYARRGATAGVS